MSNHRTRGCSSVGRALRSHRRGRGFDYHQLHEEPFCIPPQEGFSLPCESMAGFWGQPSKLWVIKVTAKGMSDDGIHQRFTHTLPSADAQRHPASAEAGTEEQSRRLMIDVLDALTITRLLRQGDLHDAIMRRNLNISRDSPNRESCSEKSPKISALREIRRVFQISRLPPSGVDYSES